jgi:histidine triad (HIT) family protein
MMDTCIFCKIIKGEIPAAKVWEDENFLVFLSINPINPGHTLVIPKKHIDYFFDLDEQTLSGMMMISKKVAKALVKIFRPKTGKVGVMVAGLGIPHAHLHLIPLNSEGDLNFERAKSATIEQLTENASKIKATMVK